MTVLLIRHSNNQPVSLTKLIADSSGEGKVWETNLRGYLAKIYHDPTPFKIAKLKVMLANPPADPMLSHNHVSIAWVSDLLKDSNGKYVGFLMPKIKDSKQLSSVCNPKSRKRNAPGFNWYYLHVTALNTAWIIQAIHAKGYVLGDIKLENILVNNRAMTAVIDTDSFQVRDTSAKKIYRCTVGSEGFTPPELLGKDFRKVNQSQNQDRFRLGVLIHYLLFGYHPFSGQWTGVGESPEQTKLIKQGYWYAAHNSPIRASKTTIPLDVVHPELKKLFLRCFNEGHTQPHLRPSALDWHNALEVAVNQLTSCSRVDNHHYSQHYGKCYWCDRATNLGVDIFPGFAGSAEIPHRVKQSSTPPKVPVKYKRETVFSVKNHSNQNNMSLSSIAKQHNKSLKQQKYNKHFSSNHVLNFIRENYVISLILFFGMLLFFILIKFNEVQYNLQNYNINFANELEKRKSKVYSLTKKEILQGEAYYSSGNYVEAIAAYIKAIEMHIKRGAFLTNVEKYFEAIDNYDRAFNVFSYIANCYYHKGKKEFGLGNYDQAIEDYSQAIYLNSLLSEAYVDRQLMEAYIERDIVISYFKNTNIENEVYTTNKYNFYLSNIYLGRGIALYNWGDKNSAYKNFDIAKDLGNQKAIERLANFQYDKNDPSSKPNFYNK